MALNANDCGYRFIVLFFNCMLTFGSYFCFDMPSVLQSVFEGNYSCPANQTNPNLTCCEECLAMSNSDYNLLYAIYAWTNALVVIAAGFFIDKLGNRIGVFLFSFLCVLGSSTFAAGPFLRGTKYLLPVMLIGRLLFGSGNGALTIVQNKITAFWFKDKELAMAFGVTLAFSRLGSVLNFLLTETFEEKYGLKWTLWFGAILCGFGFISAIVVSSLDKWGMHQLGADADERTESKKLKFTDIKYLSLSFWLVALSIMFFYNGVFPFVADASKFIQTKYKIDAKVSSYLAGAVYDVSMIVSPFLGGIIDIVGKRGILSFFCALLTVPVFGILAFSSVYPLVATVWLGITYSIAAASLWPSIPLVVSQATVGTAMGITTSIQMIGIGISNVVVGQIGGKSQEDSMSREEKLQRWKYVMIYLLGNVLACVVTTVFLNITDKRRGGILNQSRRQKRLHQNATTIQEAGSFDSSDEEVDTENDPLLWRQRREQIS